jgi:DNA-binding Xre family transcriptional regulator
MDVFMIPVAGIVSGALAAVGIAAIVADMKNKERELAHKEKMAEMELEKLKLQKNETRGEK